MGKIVDLKQLVSEFESAVREEYLKKKQNAAKIEAANKPGMTYDEFSKAVETAHLKAITKSDKDGSSMTKKISIKVTDDTKDNSNK